MPAQKDRIIVDTNLWIHFLLSGKWEALARKIEEYEVTLVFSEELLQEFIGVTQRPKFRNYFQLKDVEELLKAVRLRAVFAEVTTVISVCRDPNDNFLLALAVDSAATHLLTGDKDLLVLKKIKKTRILTIADYLKIK
ncbi:MAG: putative toxin-antitoxin system toxin component, PIN family [Chitinophagaceae bacterium]|nr:putative toxin-antitoxin system toxin component, PIN family [Chitinophagaceae bacterium]